MTVKLEILYLNLVNFIINFIFIMMNATNPSALKQEFLTTLSKTEQNSAGIEALLNFFCKISWWLEREQLECFGKLEDFMSSLPLDLKKGFIPKMIDMSMHYPRLVLLAEKLFNSLDTANQEQLNIPMIFWTVDDKYTRISANEYRYRTAHGKQVWIADGSYRRPMQPLDLVCYQKVIDMIVISGSKTVVF